MSKFYKESNAGTTKNLYDKSKIYKSELLSLSITYGCLVDFNFGEKYFYGRVDRNLILFSSSSSPPITPVLIFKHSMSFARLVMVLAGAGASS